MTIYRIAFPILLQGKINAFSIYVESEEFPTSSRVKDLLIELKQKAEKENNHHNVRNYSQSIYALKHVLTDDKEFVENDSSDISCIPCVISGSQMQITIKKISVYHV